METLLAILLMVFYFAYLDYKIMHDKIKQQTTSHVLTEEEKEEEEKQRREEIIRMGIAYNAWNHMRNHDGNPRNDSIGSAYTPGTDAWKANRRF